MWGKFLWWSDMFLDSETHVLEAASKKLGSIRIPARLGVPLDPKIQCKLLPNAQEVICPVKATASPPTGPVGCCTAVANHNCATSYPADCCSVAAS